MESHKIVTYWPCHCYKQSSTGSQQISDLQNKTLCCQSLLIDKSTPVSLHYTVSSRSLLPTLQLTSLQRACQLQQKEKQQRSCCFMLLQKEAGYEYRLALAYWSCLPCFLGCVHITDKWKTVSRLKVKRMAMAKLQPSVV